MDLVIKWRLFKHLLGGRDPYAVTLYRWHIEKRRSSGFVDGEKQKATDASTLDHYVSEAEILLRSMADNGFDDSHPVPVDPNRELLGGAHRVACAIALGFPVCIEQRSEKAWAPAWGIRWFIDNGADPLIVRRLIHDLEAVHLGCV